MRAIYIFVIGGFIILCLRNAQQEPSLAPAGNEVQTESNCVATVATGDDCQQPLATKQPAADPTSVQDRQMLTRISQYGKRLIERNTYTDMPTLIKQLRTAHCSLPTVTPSDTPLTPEQIYMRSQPSVVVVAGLYLCGKCDQWHASTATGFVISASGAIVTNYHVVDSDKKKTLVVLTADGHMLPVKRVLAANQRDDLAILQVASGPLPPLPIAKGRQEAPVGSNIYVISHPANHFYSLTTGVVSRYFRYPTRNGISAGIDITADYARGSSGAPVLNAHGQVVGIVRSTESIYYEKKNARSSNLQMVFKHCIAAERLQSLVDFNDET